MALMGWDGSTNIGAQAGVDSVISDISWSKLKFESLVRINHEME
jgi:hypothetical protein